MKLLIGACHACAVVLFFQLNICANTAPVADAGLDTITRLGREFNFYGTAADTDTLPNNDINILWRQVSGPDSGAQLGMAFILKTNVTFVKTGIYLFELSVTDGELSDYDTLEVEVQDSIPFIVLQPEAGERIRIGTTYVVRWQTDPPDARVTVELSTDAGINIEYLTTENSVTADTFVWEISDTLQPSDDCFIRVMWYKDHTKRAVSGFFSLTDSNSSVINFSRPVAPDHKSGKFFSLDGRSISSGNAQNTPRLKSATGMRILARKHSSKQVMLNDTPQSKKGGTP